MDLIMRWLRRWRLLLRTLVRRSRVDDEMTAELRFHLEQQIAENLAAGLSPAAARRRARLTFGAVDAIKEQCRDQRGLRLIDETVQDIRHGVRMFTRTPALNAVAALTLALGIGANTAVFTVVHGVLLKTLPFDDPDRLVTLWENNPNGLARNLVSPPTFTDWQTRNRRFTTLAAVVETDFVLTGTEEPERVRGASVSPNFFDTVGIRAVLGRTFRAADGRPDEPVVVVSESYWQRLGSDPNLVGQQVTLQDRSRTVVGVVPRASGLAFVSRASESPVGDIDIWEPVRWSDTTFGRSAHFLRVVGRLGPDVQLAAARAEMETIAAQLADAYPASNEGWGVTLVPLQAALVGGVTTTLLLLFGAAAAILLIACANVTNLLLSRGTTRRNEMAVRAALGARRGRLVRQVVVENLVLAVVGGGLGIIGAQVGVDILVALHPTSLPRLDDVAISPAVLAFALGLSMVAILVASLFPAVQWSRAGLNVGLSDAGHRYSGRQDLARKVLVATEVASSVVLLVAAGLLIRSFIALTSVDPGFRPAQVLTAQVTLPASRYPGPPERARFFRALIQRVGVLPGVEAVGAIGDPPLTGGEGFWRFGFTIEGQPLPPDGQRAYVRWISPGYFAAMRIPLMHGRPFTEEDLGAERPQVVVVSEALVRRFFAGTDPIGRRVQTGFGGQTWREIVGVVGDVRQTALDQEAAPHIYFAYLQTPMPAMTLVVRSTIDPLVLAAVVPQEVRALDPDQPVHNVRSAEDLVAAAVARPRFATALFGLFGVLALALTAVGVYGVVSYQVAQRTREIAVRAALGASRRTILRTVLRQGVGPVVAGAGVGLGLAFITTRTASALLFGVTATDPTTFAAATLSLVAVAFVAMRLAAGRATKADPMVALRAE